MPLRYTGISARIVEYGRVRIVVLARPEGSEHALPTFVIEGVDVLVEALRAA